MKQVRMVLLLCIAAVTGVVAANAAPQAEQPSVVEQNRVVSPKDAVKGADWLKEQGVGQGLEQLDLGVDSKGKAIRFEISKDGAGVQIRLTGLASMRRWPVTRRTAASWESSGRRETATTERAG